MFECIDGGFLVVPRDAPARQTLRGVCGAGEDSIWERFGRTVVFDGTDLGAFLAFQLREKPEEMARRAVRWVPDPTMGPSGAE